jgi:hypothetical protein
MFIVDGSINLFSKKNTRFMQLPTSAVFGDYQLHFGLKSNTIFRADSVKYGVNMMEGDDEFVGCSTFCVRAHIYRQLCELYPMTERRLKKYLMRKHDVYNFFMDQADSMKQFMEKQSASGVPVTLDQSVDNNQDLSPQSPQKLSFTHSRSLKLN